MFQSVLVQMSLNVYACAVFIFYSYVCICTIHVHILVTLEMYVYYSYLITHFRAIQSFFFIGYGCFLSKIALSNWNDRNLSAMFKYSNLDLEWNSWNSLKKKNQGINILCYTLFKDFLKHLILANHTKRILFYITFMSM